MKRDPVNPHFYIHAGLYGIILREAGHSVEDAAALVIQRYPEARERLRKIATKTRPEEYYSDEQPTTRP